jgi:hypothetical protein
VSARLGVGTAEEYEGIEPPYVGRPKFVHFKGSALPLDQASNFKPDRRDLTDLPGGAYSSVRSHRYHRL